MESNVVLFFRKGIMGSSWSNDANKEFCVCKVPIDGTHTEELYHKSNPSAA